MATTIIADGRARRPSSGAPTSVSVNGVDIPRAAISKEAQNHAAGKPVEAWSAAARALAIRELLLQEARRLGLTPDPMADGEGRRETDEEALIRALLDQEVRTPEADPSECRRAYDAHRARFRSPPLLEARHILIAAPPGDIETRAAARAQAGAILDELHARPYAFADLAETYSICPSARAGGVLGQIHPGTTVPEFEHALARLPTDTPALVETQYGWHLVVVDRRIDGRDLPFEAVERRIAAWLNDRVRHAALQQYVALLAGRAQITGMELRRAPSPLVQ